MIKTIESIYPTNELKSIVLILFLFNVLNNMFVVNYVLYNQLH